jgi:hypothetical protein
LRRKIPLSANLRSIEEVEAPHVARELDVQRLGAADRRDRAFMLDAPEMQEGCEEETAEPPDKHRHLARDRPPLSKLSRPIAQMDTRPCSSTRRSRGLLAPPASDGRS